MNETKGELPLADRMLWAGITVAEDRIMRVLEKKKEATNAEQIFRELVRTTQNPSWDRFRCDIEALVANGFVYKEFHGYPASDEPLVPRRIIRPGSPLSEMVVYRLSPIGQKYVVATPAKEPEKWLVRWWALLTTGVLIALLQHLIGDPAYGTIGVAMAAAGVILIVGRLVRERAGR